MNKIIGINSELYPMNSSDNIANSKTFLRITVFYIL